ncbi:acylphosphatase [Candidatus Microgenomates bacterium]|nr:acylphosphatase [Candidatus Microgenomates bacterium]
METRRLLIAGAVQGVGFRINARRQALKLDLRGLARNLPDGRVEIIVSGNSADIAKFLEWCRSGPRLAEVRNIEIEPMTYRDYQDFDTA